MESNKKICELLVETGVYKDLEKPVILTSGELGIYYINTEKLVQDNGEFEKYGDDSRAMIEHAVMMMHRHQPFQTVLDILAGKVEELLPSNAEFVAVSGGQRRDWLFSGPVSHLLDVPHISLYKQDDGEDKIELINTDGTEVKQVLHDELVSYKVVHVVDLITEGSSVYRREVIEKGWVPMLRNKGAQIFDLVGVVTRLQGGEEKLAKQHVAVHPFVAIDEDFLKTYSKNPKRAVAYLGNPGEWSINYLREQGALAFVDNFNPEGKKLDRATKFLKRYSSVLENCGRMQELEQAVQDKYRKSLNEIVGGN